MIATMSTLTTLLMVAAAITLFVRMRSKASALFLFGTLATLALPYLGYFLGIGSRANIAAGFTAVFVSIGPLCSGLGLLWHTLTVGKPSATEENSSLVTPTA